MPVESNFLGSSPDEAGTSGCGIADGKGSMSRIESWDNAELRPLAGLHVKIDSESKMMKQ